MRLLTFLIVLSLSTPALADQDLRELETWASPLLKEAGKSGSKKPAEAHAIYLKVAREFQGSGFNQESIPYYQQALSLKDTSLDQREPYVELIKLHLNQKEKGKQYLADFRQWLKAHPVAEKDLAPWLATMDNHYHGTQNLNQLPPAYRAWSIDNKIPELVNESKFKEAFALISKEDVSQADIQRKIRYDLLSAVASKDKKSKLHCSPVLEKNPRDLDWSMQLCRYLKGWQQDKPDSKLVDAIEKQIREDDPDNLYYVKALRNL